MYVCMYVCTDTHPKGRSADLSGEGSGRRSAWVIIIYVKQGRNHRGGARQRNIALPLGGGVNDTRTKDLAEYQPAALQGLDR